MRIIAATALFLAKKLSKLSNSLSEMASDIPEESSLSDEPACNYTGHCKPYEGDEDDPSATISNCRFCGSELHLVNGVWKNWDWDL